MMETDLLAPATTPRRRNCVPGITAKLLAEPSSVDEPPPRIVELGERLIADLEAAAEEILEHRRRSAEQTERLAALRGLATAWRELLEILPVLQGDGNEWNTRQL